MGPPMPTKLQQALTAKAHRRAKNAEHAALRRAERLAEDAEDRALVAEARAEGGEPIPWEDVKRELGL